jgi:hypothetical protein
VDQIEEIPLQLKVDAVCFGSFLNSEEHKVLQLWMVDGDVWTGLMKLYQMLENTLSMANA